MPESVPLLLDITYRCKNCGFLCTLQNVPGWNTPAVRVGDYGTNGTPTPAEYAESMYSSSTMYFCAAAAAAQNQVAISDPTLLAQLYSYSGVTVAARTWTNTAYGNAVTLARPGIGSYYFNIVFTPTQTGVWTFSAYAALSDASEPDISSTPDFAITLYHLGRGYSVSPTVTLGETGEYIVSASVTITVIEQIRVYISKASTYTAETAYLTGFQANPGSSPHRYLRTDGFARTVAAEPAKIVETTEIGFVDSRILSGTAIRVGTTSGTNDGDYTVADPGMKCREILLKSTDSLTSEHENYAGTTTISRVIAQPSITTGCPFCGTLNSR